MKIYFSLRNLFDLSPGYSYSISFSLSTRNGPYIPIVSIVAIATKNTSRIAFQLHVVQFCSDKYHSNIAVSSYPNVH